MIIILKVLIGVLGLGLSGGAFLLWKMSREDKYSDSVDHNLYLIEIGVAALFTLMGIIAWWAAFALPL